jgi:hypothetical protein
MTQSNVANNNGRIATILGSVKRKGGDNGRCAITRQLPLVKNGRQKPNGFTF